MESAGHRGYNGDMTESKILQTAREAALAAGKMLLASQKTLKASQVETKSTNDYVTHLDRASEKLIVERIRKRFPSHAILGEEGGFTPGAGPRWVIDPLDGTTNYIRRVPFFCVSIGVVDEKGPLAGVVYDPTRKELFSAERGRGAFLNGRRMRVSKVRRLGESVLSTAVPYKARKRFDPYVKCLSEMALKSSGIRRSGSAAIDLAYVACGRFDGFWALNQGAWDVAAGACLVREAGGTITDLRGGLLYFETGDLLASNGSVQTELLTLVRRAFKSTAKA